MGIYWIGPLVLPVISTRVNLVFRYAATVIIAMTIAILATVWAIAFTIFGFGEISMIVVAAAPPVIITISTCDFIHLTSTCHDELDAGYSIPDALEKTICEVGGTCVLTSLVVRTLKLQQQLTSSVLRGSRRNGGALWQFL